MEEVIAELWQDTNGPDARVIPISEILGYGRKTAPEPPLLTEWLAVFDEFTEWFVSLSTLVCIGPFVAGEEMANQEFKAFAPLLSSITSQCLAIRLLAADGLELPSKQLCRCLVEYVDLGVRMSLDTDYLAEFLAHDDLDDARPFWSRYLKRRDIKGQQRKTHVRDRLYEKWKAIMPNADIGELEAYRTEEENVLNACTHPSLVAAQMNMIGLPCDGVLSWFQFLGKPSELSARTLKYAVVSLLDYVAVGWQPDYTGKERIVMEDDLVGRCYKHVRSGRSVLISLGQYIIRNQDSSWLSLSSIITSGPKL
jgi:hypothetical protein